MRFAGARAEGLEEGALDAVVDGYADSDLPAKEIAALCLTDALIGRPHPPSANDQAALRAHYSDAQITELAIGIGLFHSLSKVLIALGLEPESMPISVVATPEDSR